MNECTILRMGVSLGYCFVALGSLGMMAFATKFGFSTDIDGYRLSNRRYLGMNGAQMWLLAWILIILGTMIQLAGYWLAGCSAANTNPPTVAVLLGDVADTSCELASVQAGRPESMETECRVLNNDLESRFNAAFRSEPACHDLQMVTLESEIKAVPKHYLRVDVWRGSDGNAQPEWQWSMDGAKFSGTAITSQQTARDVCTVMKGRGGRVE